MKAIYIDKHFDLVVGCKEGDRNAYRELYRLYSKAMYNVAMRILNHSEEAEDVLQEAFLDAFSKIKDFRQETTFGLWIKQMVIHRSINNLRKRKAIFEDIDDIDIETIVEEDAIDKDEMIFKVDMVKQAIQLLPEGYRVVLSLYLLEGYDHEEISQILNITTNTSRTQFLRAKRKLIEILKQKGVEA